VPIKNVQKESKVTFLDRGNRMKEARNEMPRRQKDKALGAGCKTMRCTTMKEREDKPLKKSLQRTIRAKPMKNTLLITLLSIFSPIACFSSLS